MFGGSEVLNLGHSTNKPQVCCVASKQTTKKTRSQFTKSEDELLKILVQKNGDYDWNTVAKGIPGKTPRQCRDRFKNYLSPQIVNGRWTKEEEAVLIMQYSKFGPKWARLNQFFPNRSVTNIKNHFSSIYRSITKRLQANARKNELIQKLDECVKRSIPMPQINSPNETAVEITSDPENIYSSEFSYNQLDEFDPFDANVFDI